MEVSAKKTYKRQRKEIVGGLGFYRVTSNARSDTERRLQEGCGEPSAVWERTFQKEGTANTF